MPPKKKGGKKGKKGKKEKGSANKGSRPVSAAEEKPLDQATKDYYLVQIRDLESRIIKYDFCWHCVLYEYLRVELIINCYFY